VRARAEFTQVFEHGRRAATPLLTLHLLSDAQPPRLGLAVSRKVDTRAVVRNRIKRILRDRFRHRRALLKPGAYVVVARNSAAKATPDALTDAFDQALRRLGALPVTAAPGTMPRVSLPSASASPQGEASSSSAP
jgi:ribonuclease P protein component